MDSALDALTPTERDAAARVFQYLVTPAGTKIALPDRAPRADGTPQSVKAAELSGAPGILFRRNSLTGGVEAVPRTGAGVTLNEVLHA